RGANGWSLVAQGSRSLYCDGPPVASAGGRRRFPPTSAASRLAFQTRRLSDPVRFRLNPRRGGLHLHHRHLVEIRGLDGQPDRRGELLTPLDELLLGLLGGILALPQQDGLRSAVLGVVERDVPGEAVVLT